MSTSLDAEREPSPTPPANAARGTGEFPAAPPELRDALHREQTNLHREVVIWQRWVRYLALGTMVLLSLVLGSSIHDALVPIVTIAVCYTAVVMSTAWILRKSPSQAAGRWFPSLLLAADIATLAGFCYLTSAPQQMHRILLLGFLSMQLGVFYFGWRQGWIAAALTVAAYLWATMVAAPFVPGPSPSTVTVLFNATLFAIISGVLIHTFGNFRERIDALRMYCKVIEHGDADAATVATLPDERRPDELTLLARSFQSMNARLAELIGSDPLTGCLNRRSLEGQLRTLISQARRRGSNLAVVAVDLDYFKEINDSRGHPVGDVVLRQLAGIMKSTARDSDAVARFGGDEFIIVLPDTGWQGALTFAERLRRRVDDYTFGPDGLPMNVTISSGVALAAGADAVTTDTLLQSADAALYKAKSAGRNRVFS